jgi:hypothetical protein
MFGSLATITTRRELSKSAAQGIELGFHIRFSGTMSRPGRFMTERVTPTASATPPKIGRDQYLQPNVGLYFEVTEEGASGTATSREISSNGSGCVNTSVPGFGMRINSGT